MKRGFTLLEIVIVVIILGILAAVAIPQMMSAVERGRSSEAYHNLGLLRQSEYRYRAEYETYTATLDDLDVDPPTGTTWVPAVTPANWHFSYAAVAAANTFTITATRARGPNVGETITINQDGTIAGTWSP